MVLLSRYRTLKLIFYSRKAYIMFKKVVVLFIVVTFLFCYKSISSLGVDAPSTIKEDIYLLNYDVEIDTLYLTPTTSRNIYYSVFFNSSPNAYLFKIKTDIPLFKALSGKEIIKNSFVPIYPYAVSFIHFHILDFNFDQTLGYLIIEFFSLEGEKIKEINIKNIIISTGTSNIAQGMPDIIFEDGIIKNISYCNTVVLVNTIQFNTVKFFKKILSPQEQVEINIADKKRNETMWIVCSNSWSVFLSKYYILNKNVTIRNPRKKIDDTKVFWCQNKNNNIYGFWTQENVFSIFCYSKIETKYNIVLKINNINSSSKSYSIKSGWNKINIVSKKSLAEDNIQLEINGVEYDVAKIFIENNKRGINFNFTFKNKKIYYPTTINNYVKFMILTTQGIMYIEYMCPNIQHIPTYSRTEKILNIGAEYDEVMVVELSTALNFIKPTLSD